MEHPFTAAFLLPENADDKCSILSERPAQKYLAMNKNLRVKIFTLHGFFSFFQKRYLL